MTSIVIYVHDWLQQRDEWGFLAAVSLHKSFVRASVPQARGCLSRLGLFTPAERKRERWAEGGETVFCGRRFSIMWRTVTSRCRLIKTRCFVLFIERHVIRCWPTYEFNSAIGCWTSWFSSKLCRLMLLISHPASTSQREQRKRGREWTEIMRVSPW